MEKIVNVLNVKRYDFEDRESGRRVLGCKLMYEQGARNEVDYSGLDVVSISTKNVDLFDKLRGILPCECKLRLDVVSRGKGVKVVLLDAEVV